MANNIEKEKVVNIQKRRETQEMFKRIRKSLEKEKEPGPEKMMHEIEEGDPNYLKLIKK